MWKRHIDQLRFLKDSDTRGDDVLPKDSCEPAQVLLPDTYTQTKTTVEPTAMLAQHEDSTIPTHASPARIPTVET